MSPVSSPAIYTQLKQPEKAVTAYQRLLTIEPGLRNSVLLSISTAYTQAGKHAEASEYAKNLVKVDQQSCAAWQRMGECYANVGNTPPLSSASRRPRSLARTPRRKSAFPWSTATVPPGRQASARSQERLLQLSREASTPLIRDLPSAGSSSSTARWASLRRSR
jgi:predicted Zn-dependent protease